jgi:hypothetical protein
MRLCLWITPISEELRVEHKNTLIQESRTSSSNFDDNHCDGIYGIALASGAGAEWKNGLAWVIGGFKFVF